MKYGKLAGLYLKLTRRVITLTLAKLNLEDFKNKINKLGKKSIERAIHTYDEMKMVVKEDVFYYPLHSNLRLNYDLNINNTKMQRNPKQ